MSNELLDIGEVIAASGLPASTLHLWEREGLVMPAGRVGLRRQYRPEVLERLATVVVLKHSGFSLAEIRGLLEPAALQGDRSLLRSKLDELKAQRARLDTAIEGIEHGLACTAPSPVHCPGFQRHLDGVLPVGDSEGLTPRP